jgi:hypothetical protein
VRAMVVLGFCGVFAAGWAQEPPAAERPPLVAILPLDNMTGRTLDPSPIAAAWSQALTARGVPLLDPESTRRVMDAHRVRDTSGLAPDVAAAFRDEAGVTGVLVISVERWDDTETPVLALTARLVSTDALPRIVWADSAGATGIDRPGFLDLGVVTDPSIVLERTVSKLAESMSASLSGSRSKERGSERRFKPRKEFRTPDGLTRTTPVRIAVLPFTNRTPRRRAGDLVTLHFVHQFAVRDDVEVVEPGVVRDILLRMRIIPAGGVAFGQAELLKELLGTEFVLTGDVLDYIDSVGQDQAPVVDFMTQLLDAGRRTIVWSSFSHNTGADRVWFFDEGRIRTAGALGSAMAQATVQRMMQKGTP